MSIIRQPEREPFDRYLIGFFFEVINNEIGPKQSREVFTRLLDREVRLRSSIEARKKVTSALGTVAADNFWHTSAGMAYCLLYVCLGAVDYSLFPLKLVTNRCRLIASIDRCFAEMFLLFETEVQREFPFISLLCH